MRKWLWIPAFINYYNHFMKGVDTADQMRSYYSSLKQYRKTWKPLFHFILDTIVTNYFKMSSFANRGWPHHAGHKVFLERLVNSLFEHSIRVAKSSRTRVPMNRILWYPAVEHGYKPEKINEKPMACSACLEAGRKSSIKKLSARKPLCELSQNTTRKPRDSRDWKRPLRAPRTQFGCRLCKIPLCKTGPCWQAHIDRINTKD